jgi:hypothetical protein
MSTQTELKVPAELKAQMYQLLEPHFTRVLTSKDVEPTDRTDHTAKVCISLVTRGWMRVETALWILAAYTQLAPSVEVQYVVGFPLVDHMRNLQVKRFLEETDCSHLFILDSDCVPQPGTIQKLLEFDLPIIASPYFIYQNNQIVPMVRDKNTDQGENQNEPYRQHKPLVGLQQCDAVGTSGLLIKREVFETIPPPYFRFRYDDDGFITRSEDVYFCEKAKAAGYKIYAYCDLVQTHIKEIPL